MKKGCLGRFVVFLLVVGCAGLGYEDYVLSTDNARLNNELAAANARLDQLSSDMKAHHLAPGAAAPAPDDWLTQAQLHANKAAEALKQMDLTTARNELQAAAQACESKPRHMSADMRARYDSLQKQVSSIKDKATSLFNGL